MLEGELPRGNVLLSIMLTPGFLNGGFILGGSPVKLKINARQVELSDDYEDGDLLWALRDGAGLSARMIGSPAGCINAASRERS